MSFLAKIDSNAYEVLISLALSNVIAQVLKTIIFSIRTKKTDLRMLFTTGGMPSSHSSSVTGMATTIGLIEGFDSIVFSLACAFAIVVMYDSAGIRRSAGRQAAVLNRIISDLFHDDHKVKQGRLKELLGHSPFEVIAGALLGILVAVYLHYQVLNYVH